MALRTACKPDLFSTVFVQLQQQIVHGFAVIILNFIQVVLYV